MGDKPVKRSLFSGKHLGDKSLAKHLSEGILVWIVKAGGHIINIYRVALTPDKITTQGYSFLKIAINLSTNCVLGALCGYLDSYDLTGAAVLRCYFVKSGTTISKSPFESLTSLINFMTFSFVF